MTSAGRRFCTWHEHGKPARASSRFYEPGCERCEEKVAAGLAAVTDVRPLQSYRKAAGNQRFSDKPAPRKVAVDTGCPKVV